MKRTAASPLAPVSSTASALMEEAHDAEKAGRREVARRRFESVLYLLAATEGGVASTILRRIARTYIDDGNFEAALDCASAAEGVSEALGDDSGVAYAYNLKAGAYLQRGEHESAEDEFLKARAMAARAGDGRLLAMIAQNLGIIANTRGDLDAALEHYLDSLRGYSTLRLDEYLAPLLNNMGMAYAHLERWADAEQAYADALVKAKACADAATALMVRVNLTDMWLARGEVTRAASYCAEVTAEAQSLGDQRALGEAAKHRGIIARRKGRLAESEQHLRAAYESAMQREDLLLAAEALREQAELYEVEGRSRDTLQALVQSHRLFTRLRARRELSNLEQRVSRLETRFYFVVRRWAETIESKDPYTRGHCDRVADLACALAREVGFDELTMFWFRMGALLHDVGKVVVPTEVLNKPGRLTPEERELMERHPEAGVDLLRDIQFPWDILPMIRGHHERWDGAGYPDRLAGEAIPRSARVLCVADVYDALTTDRPYRKAFTREEALEIMARDSGKIFEPALFEAFQRIQMQAEAPVAVNAPLTLAV